MAFYKVSSEVPSGQLLSVAFRGAQLSVEQMDRYVPGTVGKENAFTRDVLRCLQQPRRLRFRHPFHRPERGALMVPDWTPEEIDASNARIHEFIRKMKSVPESERTLLTSDRFAGPVGQPMGEPRTDTAGAIDAVEPDPDPDDEDEPTVDSGPDAGKGAT